MERQAPCLLEFSAPGVIAERNAVERSGRAHGTGASGAILQRTLIQLFAYAQGGQDAPLIPGAIARVRPAKLAVHT
ncbi:MAG: hypothetical protein DMF01_00935 [Verrucomicrobia bacterium]|nr:MAG: hypothetical protein DMF01_00935 [Verrucomicrobiota bacterium]